MIPRLYSRDTTDFTGMGICPLNDAVSCMVTEERNGQYTLEMVYPVSGQWFGEIKVDRIILAQAHESDTHPQPFRIESIEGDIGPTITINAVHISYQLNWILAGRNTYTSANAQTNMRAVKSSGLMSGANSCPFTFYSDITSTSAISLTAPESFRSFLGGVEGGFLDVYGGEFEWDVWDVHLWEERGEDNGVRITYGKNLTGIDWSTDISDTYTDVCAYWMQDNNGTVTYKASDIQTIGGDFAFQREIAVDASGEFQSEPTYPQLNAYASSYVKANAVNPTVSVSIDFVPLWQTEEYKEYAAFEKVGLCDAVTIVYPPLGLELKAQVVKTVYNVFLDRYDSIEIKTVKKSLADTIFAMEKQIRRTSIKVGRVEKPLPRM